MKADHLSAPIIHFVRNYAESGISRFHMPGHKGKRPAVPDSCERFSPDYAADLTEIKGADSLYEANGIIQESEKNASLLFDTGATFYSTEGSSQCIRAMLALVTRFSPSGSNHKPVILAARNVHRSFLTAAALLDLDIEWLLPESGNYSLCACPITAEQVDQALARMSQKPAAVYLTSPDYLGNIQDITAIAAAAHAHAVPLLVDNAHGSYLHFLQKSLHPMDLGADLCCDSAHKTLPALTGCAYLHIRRDAPEIWFQNARKALALFGSTSPSYLLLQALDAVNIVLSGSYREDLLQCIRAVQQCKEQLRKLGWKLADPDPETGIAEPLKITLAPSANGYSGQQLADCLRTFQIECEYADTDHLVLMITPENSEEDLTRLMRAMHQIPLLPLADHHRNALPCFLPEQVLSVREAYFAPSETVPAAQAIGRICADTAISCPPAVPLLVCGERISKEILPLFAHYGIFEIAVIRES